MAKLYTETQLTEMNYKISNRLQDQSTTEPNKTFAGFWYYPVLVPAAAKPRFVLTKQDTPWNIYHPALLANLMLSELRCPNAVQSKQNGAQEFNKQGPCPGRKRPMCEHSTLKPTGLIFEKFRMM